MYTIRLNSCEKCYVQRVCFSIRKAFAFTWCAALEDLENCFSKMFFKSTGKLPCEPELKEKSTVLNYFKIKQSCFLYKEKNTY